ncbi:hypothetical protein VMCG_00914 [Cytospora schulzeri]|uniref:PinX1-related protein 1 n=1 Tax=Cytospora schulzeri TaxID=448051 RepID=A0A423X596_9PEZI|nr:hypothetical protein VMCG_00914 [Valsa malicola]
MGLAGVKNKKKWAKDPNNTAWSRNADTFGQKIMRSQGWAPGEYLGAKDASHSEFYSAANASHIRAVMKDDNMGLGAKRNQGDECTGLDALQDLLSRLNGKSEESMGEERRKREDTKINKYLNRKIGTMRFVFGGLLVGDKVQELADSLKEKDQGAAKVPGQGQDDAASSASSSSEEEEEEESAASAKKSKKSKKRKSEDDEDQKKSKKSKKRKTDDAEDDSKSKRKDKKDKKRRKEREEEDESSPAGDADESAAARKKSKKEKKEKRRKSKGDNDDDDTDNEDDTSADASDSQSRKKKKEKKKEKKRKAADKDDDGETTKSSTPTAVPVPHRHLARSRFIAQKRAAVMDQAALNQIFMIKA